MIDKITIAGVATFGNQQAVMGPLSQFNYLFGSNATGKTTISRVIAHEDDFPSCQVKWQGGTKLQTLVYNRDFIDLNFNPSAELKGVFTLGEQQKDTLAEIDAKREELKSLTVSIEQLKNTLEGAEATGGKKADLVELENAFKDKCWTQKQRHDVKLKGAFEGYRGSSERFKEKILEEHASNNATLLIPAELEENAERVFSADQVLQEPIPSVDGSRLLAHESNPILRKRVVGKENVDIAGMIKKLGNSDWILHGKEYYDVNDGYCPFCQQRTDDTFDQSLKDYFDETFKTDNSELESLTTNYKIDSSHLLQQVSSIIESSSIFLDLDSLKAKKELLQATITTNLERLAAKKKEISREFEMVSIQVVMDSVNTLIQLANESVRNHNDTVENIANERATLTSQVWRFVLNELRFDLSSYMTKHNELNKAIDSLNGQISDRESDIRRTQLEIADLEKQLTSVQPTVDDINAILQSFGFDAFSVKRLEDDTSYRLVRSDGSEAKATLSEGEKSFIAFLYFYHLLKGSNSEDGITNERVVVFDDPVSSLDSDILFIVSSLIRGIIDEIREGHGIIKQVFIFSHNVYFHKEVTFNSKRQQVAMKEETFWMASKLNHVSKIENFSSNPIKTSYELMWMEVKNPKRSNLTIRNTLRRILESYFKILGGIDPDDIISQMDGKDKILCKSLFSWVNDGSHSVQ